MSEGLYFSLILLNASASWKSHQLLHATSRSVWQVAPAGPQTREAVCSTLTLLSKRVSALRKPAYRGLRGTMGKSSRRAIKPPRLRLFLRHHLRT